MFVGKKQLGRITSYHRAGGVTRWMIHDEAQDDVTVIRIHAWGLRSSAAGDKVIIACEIMLIAGVLEALEFSRSLSSGLSAGFGLLGQKEKAEKQSHPRFTNCTNV